jgi:restriction system protein
MFLAVLEHCAGTPETTVLLAREPVVQRLGITQEEAREILPSGSKTRFQDRIYWAFAHLRHAGLLERPRHGIYRITGEGRRVLGLGMDSITPKFLERYETYRAFISREGRRVGGGAKGRGPAAKAPEATGSEEARRRFRASTGSLSGPMNRLSGLTPEQARYGSDAPDSGQGGPLAPGELLDTTCRDLEDEVIDELKSQIRQISPAAFERLILEVMDGLKYSSRRFVRLTGQGRDGFVAEDALGLGAICLRAEPHAGGPVGRMAIQAFAETMDGLSVAKGVFVTSGTFTRDAAEFAKSSTKPIRLVDGDELAGLMCRHNIGVRVRRSVEIKGLDTGFFKALEH